MPNIWFTADPHLNHVNAVKNFRTQFGSLEEMNEQVIEDLNANLNDEDTLYIVGDLCFGNPNESVDMVRRIKGKKHLLAGNHDTDAKLKRYAEAGLFESILWASRVKIGNRHLYLSHYPTRMDSKKRGAIWCVHGHIHTSTPFSSGLGQNIHVGWETFPQKIEYTELRELIKAQEQKEE